MEYASTCVKHEKDMWKKNFKDVQCIQKCSQCFTFPTFRNVTAFLQNGLKISPQNSTHNTLQWQHKKLLLFFFVNKNKNWEITCIHSLCSRLCWCTLWSNYSFKSSSIWSNKLGTPFFLVSPISICFYLLHHYSSFRLDGKHWCTAILRISPEMFNWILVCLGHSNTFTELLWSHSFGILAVCA